MPHLGVATLTGVAPDSVWQGDYLLKGLEHLRAYGTVAPAAAGLTVGTELKLIDSATRTDYGLGIGQCIGLLLHCIPSCSTCPWLSNQIQFESSRFVRSDHPVSSPCARWATICPKANGRRVLIHLPHGYVSYATWSIFWITLYTSRINRMVGETPMFQKMAKWHMRGVAPFVTLLRASVSQGTGRGRSSVMVLPRTIAQPHL
jgi:hypothetical protein